MASFLFEGMVRSILDRVNNLGLEPTTPGLKDVGYTCCSMLIDTELEHIVRRLAPDLYLMCCPVLGAGVKFVNKSVNKMGISYRLAIGRNQLCKHPAASGVPHIADSATKRVQLCAVGKRPFH